MVTVGVHKFCMYRHSNRLTHSGTADNENGAVTGLAYNHANRLKQASLNGTPTHDYSYNALGQRVSKAPVGNPSGATHFHYKTAAAS
jgi:YD repeat-containing protein